MVLSVSILRVLCICYWSCWLGNWSQAWKRIRWVYLHQSSRYWNHSFLYCNCSEESSQERTIFQRSLITMCMALRPDILWAIRMLARDNSPVDIEYFVRFYRRKILFVASNEVFSEVEPVIKSVLDGYNACIFFTWTDMHGRNFHNGRYSRFAWHSGTGEALFKQRVESNHAHIINFSILGIYLGNLRDLIITQPVKATDPMPPCKNLTPGKFERPQPAKSTHPIPPCLSIQTDQLSGHPSE